MERVISYTSKVRHLLECVSKQTEFSESWMDNMDVFLPYLSESFFSYKNESQLHQAQSLFLNLGNNMVDMVWRGQSRFQQSLLKYLTLLVVRKEFFLTFNGYEDTLPDPESELFQILVAFLKLLKRLLMLVPKALELNSAATRDFACRVLILASYRFPSFRITLLNVFSTIIPSRYHLDISLVDIIQFKYPHHSVCDKYDEALFQFLDADVVKNFQQMDNTDYVSTSNIRSISESQQRLLTIHDRIVTRTKSRDDLHLLAQESIPPPYIMKPLSEFLNVDEGEVIEKKEIKTKHAFKKRMNQHHKDMQETIENDNPFSTSTIASLIHSNSVRNCKEEDTPSDSDIRYPSLCLVPFFELGRVIRSKTCHKCYQHFTRLNPDFFNWGDIACVLGDDFLADLPNDWFSKFRERSYLIFQYLSTFIELCEDSAYIAGLNHVFWEGIPGYFLYLQVFLTVYQYSIIQKSSQFILLRNGEADIAYESYMQSCVNYYLLNGMLVNNMIKMLFMRCRVNILYDIIHALFQLNQVFMAIRMRFNNLEYENYPFDFYKKAYQSPEIQCLFELEQANKKSGRRMEIYPHISRVAPLSRLHERHKVEGILHDMSRDCNTTEGSGEWMSNEQGWRDLSASGDDACGLSLDGDEEEECKRSEESREHDTSHINSANHTNHYINSINHENHEHIDTHENIDNHENHENHEYHEYHAASATNTQHFLVRRQSSSMVFDPNDIDRVIEEQNEVTVEDDQGVILTLHREDSSSEQPGIPLYRIDNVRDIHDINSPPHSSHTLRSMNSSSSSSSTLSSPPMSKRSSMHGRAGYENASKNRIEIVSLHCNALFSHDLCFTHFQAMEYWMQKKIISSRGEGANLMHRLIGLRIVKYRIHDGFASHTDSFSRRFHVTTLKVKPLEEVHVWEEPEFCPYEHRIFAAQIDFCFLFSLFSMLLDYEHLSVLEKTLYVIYANMDFFTGETRIDLFLKVIYPHFPRLFSHWSPTVRQLFHRVLAYKTYHSRRSYLPAGNSCEWLAIICELIRSYHQSHPRSGESVPTRGLETINLFDLDLQKQNEFVSGFDALDETAFNQRTDLHLRCKRIRQCCMVSKRRESEAIDLLLSKKENDALLELLRLLDPNPNLFTLNQCIDVFEKEFVPDCPLYIKMHLDEEIRPAKGCEKILPDNQKPYFWQALMEYMAVLGVYEVEMERTRKKSSLFSRMFGRTTYSELLNKMEAPVEDKNYDLSSIISPSYFL